MAQSFLFLLLSSLCAMTVHSSQNRFAHNITIVLDLTTANQSLTADSNITAEIVAVIIEDLESYLYAEYTVVTSTSSLESSTSSYLLSLRLQVVSNTAEEIAVDAGFLSNDTQSYIERLYGVTVNVDSVDIERVTTGNDNGVEDAEEVPVFDDRDLTVIFVFVVAVVMMLSLGTAILIKKCRNAVDTLFFVVSATNFASDISLSVIVFMMYEWSKRAVHLYLCIACIVFCALPLVLNIVYGVKNGCLENRKLVRNSLLLMATADAYFTLKLLNDVSVPRIKNISMLTQYVPQFAIQCFLLYDFLPQISVIFALSAALELAAAIGGVFVCRDYTKRGFNKHAARLMFIVDEADELQGIKQRHKEKKFVLQLKLAEILCVNKDSLSIGGIWCITQRDCVVEVVHWIPEEISDKQRYVHSMYENTMAAIGKLFKDVYLLITDIEPRIDEDAGFITMQSATSMRNVISTSLHNANGVSDEVELGATDNHQLGLASQQPPPMGMQTSVSSNAQPADNKSLMNTYHHGAQESYIDI